MKDNKKSATKLGFWAIFICVLIVITIISNNNSNSNSTNYSNTNNTSNKEETSSFKTYDEMQSNLLTSDYNYKYIISIGDNLYIYSGIVSNDENIGYRESNTGIIKYNIDLEENIVYQDILGDLQAIDNLYEGIESSYLNLEVLFNNLKEYLYNVEKNEERRIITYDKEGYRVIVTTDLDNITNISITTEDSVYDMEFSYN